MSYKKSIYSLIVLAIILIFTNHSIASAADYENSFEEEDNTPIRGKVLEILESQVNEIAYSGGSIESESHYMKVRITEGYYKNEVIKAEYQLNSFNPAYNVEIRKGDGVLLYLDKDDAGNITHAYVAELLREKYILYIAAAFTILLLVIGKTKGLKAVISLALTCVAIVKILLPLVLKGHNPILITIGICIAIIAITLTIISGFNRKTLSAVVGTGGGLMAAGIIVLVIGSMARLTGISTEEAQMLMYIPQSEGFDFRGLLFSGILIGALGAVMDVGMSIASSMYEIESATSGIKTKDLIKSGMNVGKDIMATMSNTLILAYTGGSLQMMLLLMAYQVPLVEIVNADFMASEVLRALAGSIGLIFTIPITALAAAVFRNVKKPSEPRIIEKNPNLFPEEQGINGGTEV